MCTQTTPTERWQWQTKLQRIGQERHVRLVRRVRTSKICWERFAGRFHALRSFEKQPRANVWCNLRNLMVWWWRMVQGGRIIIGRYILHDMIGTMSFRAASTSCGHEPSFEHMITYRRSTNQPTIFWRLILKNWTAGNQAGKQASRPPPACLHNLFKIEIKLGTYRGCNWDCVSSMLLCCVIYNYVSGQSTSFSHKLSGLQTIMTLSKSNMEIISKRNRTETYFDCRFQPLLCWKFNCLSLEETHIHISQTHTEPAREIMGTRRARNGYFSRRDVWDNVPREFPTR